MDIEEVTACNLRIVLRVNEVASRQVYCSKVGSKIRDVYAEYFGEKFPMLTRWIELSFSGIGAYQKCPPSAGWVHNLLFASPDTEAVNQVYNLYFGIELAELVPFLWGDEALKYVTYDFIIKLREIKLMYLLNKLPPMCYSGIRIEGYAIPKRGMLFTKDSLIITGDRLGFTEISFEVETKLFPGINVDGHAKLA